MRKISLHKFVEKKAISKFVTKAIEKALESPKNKLKSAFKDAESDSDIKEIMNDWSILDGEDWMTNVTNRVF